MLSVPDPRHFTPYYQTQSLKRQIDTIRLSVGVRELRSLDQGRNSEEAKLLFEGVNRSCGSGTITAQLPDIGGNGRITNIAISITFTRCGSPLFVLFKRLLMGEMLSLPIVKSRSMVGGAGLWAVFFELTAGRQIKIEIDDRYSREQTLSNSSRI